MSATAASASRFVKTRPRRRADVKVASVDDVMRARVSTGRSRDREATDEQRVVIENRFARRHGKVVDCWSRLVRDGSGRRRTLGVLRTDRGDVYVRYPTNLEHPPEEVYDGLWRVRMLVESSGSLLTPQCRRIVAGRLVPIAVVLLDAIADPPSRAGSGAGAKLPASVRRACAELDEVVADIRFLSEARRQVLYLLAMLCGTLLPLLAMPLLPLDSEFGGLPFGMLVGAAMFGGVGTLMSVLHRINRGAFHLEYDTPLVNTAVAGLCRPLIGSVLAVVLTLAMRGGLALQVPQGGEPDLVLPVFAFLTGFSERWATMLLNRAGSEPPEPPASTPKRAPGHALAARAAISPPRTRNS